MKTIALAISCFCCICSIASSQEQTPQLLLHAAQCLEAKKFLPTPGAEKLTFGYVLDKKSYPGQTVIYVVSYPPAAQSDGSVYTVFLTERASHQVFNIQNNASFILSKDEPIGVSFVDPPLGGTWTQEHLASAIKEIQKHPRFAFSIRELLTTDTSLVCESYTDPQPKKKAN